MKLIDHFKSIYYLPKRVGFISERNKKIEITTNKTKKEVETLKSDLNIIFKYLSGLELHPKMSERLIVSDYRDVNKDHLVRYMEACKYIKSNDKVLDFACGCGYGSSCIQINADPAKIIGCDIDKDAIEFANRFFGKQGIEFNCMDVSNVNNFEPNSYDVIISFETIEHVPLNITEKTVSNFYSWLKPEGKIVCSVPNENINPFKTANNPYHFKHFTHVEFKFLLENSGFKNIQFIEEIISSNYQLPLGSEFDSIIAVAEKI